MLYELTLKKVVPILTLAGLRPGEKLFEEKLMAEEGLKKTKNKLIHMSDDALYKLNEPFAVTNIDKKNIQAILAEIVRQTQGVDDNGNNEENTSTNLGMAGDLAGLCTDIVTYDGGIPTGCPTSQIIAYYAYENMFNEIYRVACKYGCEYTVYVDDMTFSSKKPFDINQMKNEIDCILRKYGHKPKYKKVKYYSKGKSVPITGTIVTENHELKVPNRLQKRVYDDFQELKLFDRKELSDDEIKKLNSLKGRIQASRNIEEGKFPEINRLTNLIG